MDERDVLVDQLVRYAYDWSPEPKFELVSGELSQEYLDCKQALSHAKTMAALGRVVCARLDHAVEAIGGLTMGADPIAMSASQASYGTAQEVRWFSVRKEPKRHGLGKFIEGSVRRGDKIAVVDDVVTTGGSTIQAIERCKEAGLDLCQVLVLVDRQEHDGLGHIARAAGCEVEAICTKAEIAEAWQKARARPAS